MMEEASLLSLPEGMRVEHIQITEHGLVIEVKAAHPTSCCPLCAQTSDSIKTHYRRVLRDAPCEGIATKEIAGRLGMSDRTVRDWLKQGAFPEAQKRRKKQSSFESFAPYVLKRWQDGEHNGQVLWREIKSQGYTGTERSVYRYLKTLKQAEVRASLNPERLQKYSVNAAIWLFVRDLQKLDEIEREDLVAFCQASAVLKKAYDLLQDFLSMVHKREGQLRSPSPA
jgi:transposase